MLSHSRIAVVLLALAASGCGTYVPGLREDPFASQADTQNLIDAVVQSVRCELKTAVTRVVNQDLSEAKGRLGGRTYVDFLDGWGAEVAFTFTIIEKTGGNPNILLTPPSPASAVFSFTGAFSGSVSATRVEKLNYFFTVRELYMPRGTTCDASHVQRNDSLLVQNDLKIEDILYGRIGTDVLGLSHTPNAGQKNVLSHEISFHTITELDATPTLKLRRATLNPAGNLLSLNRDRTPDLVITFGPLDKTAGGRTLIEIAEQSHHDLQISNQVTSGFKSALFP